MDLKKLWEALQQEENKEHAKLVGRLREGINSDTVSKKFFAMLTDTLEDFEEDEDENLTEDDRARILAVLLNAEGKKHIKTNLWRKTIEKLYHKGSGTNVSASQEEVPGVSPFGASPGSYGGFREAAAAVEFYTEPRSGDVRAAIGSKDMDLKTFVKNSSQYEDISMLIQALQAKMKDKGYHPTEDFKKFLKNYFYVKDDTPDVMVKTHPSDKSKRVAAYDEEEMTNAKEDNEFFDQALKTLGQEFSESNASELSNDELLSALKEIASDMFLSDPEEREAMEREVHAAEFGDYGYGSEEVSASPYDGELHYENAIDVVKGLARRHGLLEKTNMSQYGFSEPFIAALYEQANLKHDAELEPSSKKPSTALLEGNVLLSKNDKGEYAIWRPSTGSSNEYKGYILGVAYDYDTDKISSITRDDAERISNLLPRGEYYTMRLYPSEYAHGRTRNRPSAKIRHADTYQTGWLGTGRKKPHVRTSTPFAADAGPSDVMKHLKKVFLPRLEKKADDLIDKIYGAMRYLDTESQDRGAWGFNKKKSQAEEALGIVQGLNDFLKTAFEARDYGSWRGDGSGFARLIRRIRQKTKDPNSVLYGNDFGLGAWDRDSINASVMQALEQDPKIRFEFVKDLESVIDEVEEKVDELISQARAQRRR